MNEKILSRDEQVISEALIPTYTMRVPTDSEKIVNIKNAEWLRTITHYPRTVEQMKMLVSVLDKVGITNKYDLSMTQSMNSENLNIFYAILRIVNKVFNGYLDYVVRKIFICGLKDLFVCTDLVLYDLFFDQMTQDFYHFIPLMINLYPNKTDVLIIKKHFCDYLRTSFSKPFYEELITKLDYDITENFYVENNQFFLNMTQNFLEYTHQCLSETNESMDIFLEEIFNSDCSRETIDNILECLKQHIDLDNIFEESCVEIDIYSELKLNSEIDDLELSFSDFFCGQKNTDILLQNIGYHIYENNNKYKNDMDIFQPFIDHNLISSKKDIIEMLLQILIKYRKESCIINTNHNITLRDYYQTQSMMDYNDFCLYIATNKKLPNMESSHIMEFIMRIFSRLFNVEILLFCDDLAMIKIDNVVHKKYNEVINIYRSKDHIFYTLYSGKIFKPISKNPKSKNDLLTLFKKNNNLGSSGSIARENNLSFSMSSEI